MNIFPLILNMALVEPRSRRGSCIHIRAIPLIPSFFLKIMPIPLKIAQIFTNITARTACPKLDETSSNRTDHEGKRQRDTCRIRRKRDRTKRSAPADHRMGNRPVGAVWHQGLQRLSFLPYRPHWTTGAVRLCQCHYLRRNKRSAGAFIEKVQKYRAVGR